MDENVGAALDLLLSGGDALDVVVAAERVKAWVDARQLQALHMLGGEQPSFLDDTGRMIDPATGEAAAALRWSTGAARERIDLAGILVEDLPGVFEALERGLIDAGRAREIMVGTCELAADVRVWLAGQAVEYAMTHTRGQVRAWLARRIARIDPEAADRKHRARVKKRCVRLWADPDGMATISAYLSAEEAQAVWASLRGAAAGIDAPWDVANADAFVGLMTGTVVGTLIPVTVLQTSAGEELAGYGPISPGHAAKLRCVHSTLIDLTVVPEPSGGYRPAPRLARWVRATHRHCRFPGCRRPGSQCDLDHVVPFPAGGTCADNLAPLCRYHHRLKTHANWRVQALGGGHLRWTSPRGRTYDTFLHDP
ncbi:MAG: DUF222 domain-containing protein [Actinobacteria bacterium]|nr:DUF222 domain-containing protein [Actinomycetota bacterium]MCO5299902.1 HNH endonuclease [Candidatus Nanopelagicales bacterium]